MKERKLAIIRDLLDKYPSLAVCGSIGLHLHGVKFNRDIWEDGDIDMISNDPEFGFDMLPTCNLEDAENSLTSDFIWKFKKDGIKYNIGIDENIPHVSIGGLYRAVPVWWTMFYKAKYATEGVVKHQNDIRYFLTS